MSEERRPGRVRYEWIVRVGGARYLGPSDTGVLLTDDYHHAHRFPLRGTAEYFAKVLEEQGYKARASRLKISTYRKAPKVAP